MKLHSKRLVAAATIIGATAAIAGIGTVLASADTSSANQPRAGIARYTIRQDRLSAEAEVLNTTPSQLENQLKTQTMAQVIKAAGLNKATFRQKVKTQLQTDLQNQGYSQSQINKALSKHLKHKKA